MRVVWGTGDTIFDPSGPEQLARIFPNFQGARRIPGAALFFPEEMPDLIAEEALRLWQKGTGTLTSKRDRYFLTEKYLSPFRP